VVKAIDEMSFEELGRLFPIILSEHDPAWAGLYAAERDRIARAVGRENIARISHCGSTSIPGLIAKPTIDILIEIKDTTDTAAFIRNLTGIGYGYTPQPRMPPPHMMFMKGYSPQGFKGQAYHVHVKYPGDWDELVFRDYLAAHPETAQEYADIKIRLKEKFEYDREAYTQGKTDFIRAVVQKARATHHEKSTLLLE
jgi:GrpB-like predicted nucleotidyltransferase (UPF0157 family)